MRRSIGYLRMGGSRYGALYAVWSIWSCMVAAKSWRGRSREISNHVHVVIGLC